MKNLLLPSVLILLLTSCFTTNNSFYVDPNYLGSDEFSTYQEMNASNQIENETLDADTSDTNYYETDDYYDYSFSSRIRRFHRPMYNTGYYGGIYTDYYWYNNDPFYCGTSIYYGYNWNSPYYSYYSYSPFYYDYYYTPYYTGGYYSYYGYSYNNHHHHSNNNYSTIHTNSNTNHSYTTGHRRSLSSQGNRGVKNTTLNTSRPNTSTLQIRNNTTIRNNISIKNNTTNSTVKTTNSYRGNTTNKNTYNNSNYKGNNSGSSNTITKSTRNDNSGRKNTKTKTTNRSDKSYTVPRSNNRSYKSNSGSNRSNSGSRSSVGNRRSTKPRK
jgi:hypothetical protein